MLKLITAVGITIIVVMITSLKHLENSQQQQQPTINEKITQDSVKSMQTKAVRIALIIHVTIITVVVIPVNLLGNMETNC